MRDPMARVTPVERSRYYRDRETGESTCRDMRKRGKVKVPAKFEGKEQRGQLHGDGHEVIAEAPREARPRWFVKEIGCRRGTPIYGRRNVHPTLPPPHNRTWVRRPIKASREREKYSLLYCAR